MDAYVCPKGHNSIDSDYCSECGAKMPAASGANPPLSQIPDSPSHSGPIATEHCPACGAPRELAGLAFCEICGWDFASGPAAGTAITAPTPSDPVADATQGTAPAAPMPLWSATVEVDLLLRQQASPFPPAGILPLTVALSQPVSLIGRRSEARAIFPEIPLAYDDAVSHRHALLQIDPNGALLVRDIGSSNGTRLNGQEIAAMRDYPLKDGDQITLGHFTRITVKAIQ